MLIYACNNEDDLYIATKSPFSASIENVRVSDQIKHAGILISVLCAMKIYSPREKVNHFSDSLLG